MATQLQTYQNQVAELYIVFFGRAPDAQGMNHWVQALSNGSTINEIAAGFAKSKEFQSTYGSLSNSDAIHRFYQNALDRDADKDGLAFWLNKLQQGHTFDEIALGKIETASAGADTAHPEDTAIVRNKIEIAKYVSLVLASNDAELAAGAFDGLTTDPGSVSTVEQRLYKQADPQGQTIDGTASSEVLTGTAGADMITGGKGADTLTGGLGEDTFIFSLGDSGVTLETADVITDFGSLDGIDIKAWNGDHNYRLGDLASFDPIDLITIEESYYGPSSESDAFVLFAADADQAFSGPDQSENSSTQFPTVYIQTNVNGSKDAWMVINIKNVGEFDAEDSVVVLEGVGSGYVLVGQITFDF